MPLISSIITVSIHLIFAFLINLWLKKLGVLSDMEFMLAYFIVLALKWRSTLDKLWINLILNPVATTSNLLIEGLKRRESYVRKHQKRPSNQIDSSPKSR